MLVVDGAGRRLGYTGSGTVTEIPNSVWFGGADGRGWVLGPLQEPVSVQLTGRGEPHYVMLNGEQSGAVGGVINKAMC